MTLLPRALGVLTAAYGAAVLVRPAVLAKPGGLVGGGGDGEESDAGTAVLVRAIGARDLASGLAMACAPRGAALRWAIGVRVAAELADAVGFGLALPDEHARRKAAVVAGAWGAACAASALTLGRGKAC